MSNLFPPTVNANESVVEIGQQRAFHTLFEVSDIDNNDILKYRFRDNSNTSFGSFFTLNGVRQDANTWVEIDAAYLYEVKYNAALIEHSESFSVQVYDGKWSNVDAAVIHTVTANSNAPVVSGAGGNVLETEIVRIEDFFTVTDLDDSPITNYYFVDRRLNQNGGHFLFDGQRVQSASWFLVAADELELLEYSGGAFGPQSENVGVRAYDGKFWSDTVDFAMQTDPNQYRPVATAFGVDTKPGLILAADSLFSWTDQDGNTAKQYRFYDTGPDASSGRFAVNGVFQNAEQWFVVEADQLGSVYYHTSGVPSFENFRVSVYDGRFWSPIVANQIRSVPRPDIAVTDYSISIDYLEKTSVSDLFFKADNGPAFTQYQVMDENGSFRSGELWMGNRTLEQGVLHTFSPAEFNQLEFEGAVSDFGRQVDEIMVRADNGVYWTEWERIRVNTDPVGIESIILRGADWTQYYDGEKTIIPFTFIDGNGTSPPLPSYYPDPAEDPYFEANGTTPPDNAMREDIREVLAYFESVCDVDFFEVPYTHSCENAIMVFGLHEDDGVGGVAAHAYLPYDEGYGTFGGDVWYDVADFPVGGTEVGMGSLFRSVTFHEIGHAMGFGHSFPALPVSVDYTYNTMMSYSGDSSFHPEEPSTMMLWDVEAIQEVYGANMEYALGNTHHFYNQDNSHLQTLWDAGGIDTINMTNQVADNFIDLHQGARSTLNGVANSLLIAYGCTIENARGGYGADEIQGNEIRNLLFGNYGNDILEGNGGNDVLRGGYNDDTYIWRLGDGRDTIREEKKAGLDAIEIHDGTVLDSLEDDFVFRRFGRDLRIDLTLNQGPGHGTVLVKDMQWGNSQVEVLRLFDGEGDQIGEDIDLKSIFLQADTSSQRFRVTDNYGEYGFIAVPV